jgi:hypothetical protein
MKKMSNVTMPSSLRKSVSLVWVCGVEKGERGKAWGTGETPTHRLGGFEADKKKEAQEHYSAGTANRG